MNSPTEHTVDPTGSITEQIANAARIHRELESDGLQVRFLSDAGGARRIELRESDGDMVRELSIAEALDLAAGGVTA
jgi:hypothetical protein